VKKLKKKYHLGFTIVESLVAISVLMVLIAAPLSAGQDGLRNAFLSRDKMTASFLAQDVLEYLRNKRDSNVIQGGAWNSFFDICAEESCVIDTVNDRIEYYSTCLDCALLQKNQATGLYGYKEYDPGGGAWDKTIFSRDVSIVSLSDDEIEVVVNVTWKTGTFNQSLTVSSRLFNWLK